MKFKTNTYSRPSECIIYMEVYGSNRVVYRVTVSSIVQHGVSQPTYGVMLEDLRSGEQQSIVDFSTQLDETIVFANDLIRREICPSGLYDVAFAYLSHQVLSSRKSFSR